MKKLISFIMILSAMTFSTKAFGAENLGDPKKPWTHPVVFAYDEEVTWYFDLSETSFEAGTDLYLWVWTPTAPDDGNYENSSEFAKLEYVGDMVWKKTLIPTKYFGVTVNDFINHTESAFYMLLKTKDGAFQTGGVNIPFPHFTFDAFREGGNIAQIYPEKFYADQPMSILVNAKSLWVGDKETSLDGKEIHFHSGLNNFDPNAQVEYQAWIPESAAKTKMKNVGNGIYKIDFIPRQYYGIGEEYVMENIEFILPTLDWGQVGVDKGGKNFLFYAPEAIIPPDPVFTYFPKRFSQYDILSLVRTNNEKGNTGLVYMITAGTKVITGEFTGSVSKREAYINLLAELEGVGAITKISLEVKDKNGVSIEKTDIPLVPVTDLD